jgi:hypothetical protein
VSSNRADRWRARRWPSPTKPAQPGLRCIAHAFYGGILDALGEHEEAQRITEGVAEFGQQAGWVDAVLWYFGMMFLPWLFAGQSEILAALTPHVLAEYPRVALLQLALDPALRAVNGDGDEELADFLAKVPSVLPTVPMDFLWLYAPFTFAFAMGFGMEDSAAAAAINERLLPYRSLHGAAGCCSYFSPIEVALAITARAMGDLDTDAPGDRQQAAALLQETLEYSRTKGYTFFVEKCEELLASACSGVS